MSKEQWYCFSSRYSIAKWVHQSIEDWLAIYDVPKAAKDALELDMVEAMNRECRCVQIQRKK